MNRHIKFFADGVCLTVRFTLINEPIDIKLGIGRILCYTLDGLGDPGLQEPRWATMVQGVGIIPSP